jgi:hypothetical protein
MVYEVDGDQYIAIVTGGNSIQGSAYGDAVWTFSLRGQLGPLWPPPPPITIAGPGGAVAEAHLGQPDGISPSRMAEMLEVDKAGQKVRC